MADANEALTYISFLSRHLHKGNVEDVATLIMIDLNFVETHDGFDYLRRAIARYLQYDDRVQMKVLYSDVGRSYPNRVKRKQVERSVRYAIDEAWKSGEEKRWRRLFPVNDSGEIEKPTASAFIFRIANLIQVWQHCKENVYDEMGS